MALISSCLHILNTTPALLMHSIRKIKCLICYCSNFNCLYRHLLNYLYRRLLNCLFSLKSKLLLLLLALRYYRLLPLYATLINTYA